MADCNICGKPAGLLRSVHKECSDLRVSAVTDIETAFRNIMLVEQRPSPPMFRAIVEKIADQGHIGRPDLKSHILSGLKTSLATALEDHELSQNEVDAFQSIMDAFDLEAEDLDAAGIRRTFVQALILRDLADGPLKPRVQTDIPLPVALKRGEAVAWVFLNTTRKEAKTTVSYEGKSHGVSLRVMKGVSYRVGASKGHRVESTHLADVGSGNLIATTHALYFVSPVGTKKIALSHVVAVENFSDGISVSVDRGKQQYFMLDEPTFATNLILKLTARL